MPNFTPNLSNIEPGVSHARRCLIETVKQLAKHKGITQDDIAERSGLIRSNVSRVLSGKYDPKLGTFLKIVTAIDAQLTIEPDESTFELPHRFAVPYDSR